MIRVALLALLLHGAAPAAPAARTYTVTPGGDDAAAGTGAAPLRTISRAAELAMPGDTVLVKAGVYRERVAPPRGGEEDRPITFRGEEPGAVFIRGSDEWQPEWRRHKGTTFYAVPDEAMFSDDVYHDSANPFRVPLASTPHARDGAPEVERGGEGDADLSFTCGQVIVNGAVWEQRPFLSEVETRPETWCYRPSEGRIVINFGALDPAAQLVEISTRRRIFAPHVRGLGHLVVEGFVLEHCGNQYPTNFWNTPEWAQAGALGLRGGHHWIVRGNVIRHVGTLAMDVGSGGGDNERESPRVDGPMGQGNVIENNHILDNGAGGIVGSGSGGMVVRGNVILRNNTLGFVGRKRYEHGGLKFHYVREALIERNYVADNPRSPGIWLDNQFPQTRVTRNVIINNGERGIFLEMSDYQWETALVDHNISIGNDIQFYAHDASGSTAMHNLFANSPADAKYGQGFHVWQVNPRTTTGYHSLFNNLFINHKDGVMLDIDYPAHRGGPQRFDHNVYDGAPDARAFVINRHSDKPSPWEPAEFFALVRKDVGGGDPQPLHGGAKVAMKLEEWRAFWDKHGERNDRGSVLREGMVVAYDAATRSVTITLPFDPTTVGSRSSDRLEGDFFGRPLPGDGSAVPGPFQALRKGDNRFVVWDGLPLLGMGELPRDR